MVTAGLRTERLLPRPRAEADFRSTRQEHRSGWTALAAQQGVDIIPKTTHLERMQVNLDIFDFELMTEEMLDIKVLDTGRSQFGWW